MKPAGVHRLAALVLAWVLLIQPAVAASDDSSDFSPLFATVSDELNVPLPLLRAIARVESDQHSFALNIEGKSFFFATKAEAITAARRALAAGKSFDSGIMQVNSQWLARFNISLATVFDPAANIWLGAWILRQNIKQHGNLKTAVAHYHSPDAERGNRYALKVSAALAKEIGQEPEPQPEIDVAASASVITPQQPQPTQRFAQRQAAQQSKEKIETDQAATAPLVTRSVTPKAATDFVRRMPKTFRAI